MIAPPVVQDSATSIEGKAFLFWSDSKYLHELAFLSKSKCGLPCRNQATNYHDLVFHGVTALI